MNCKKCNGEIGKTIIINDKICSLSGRKYCIVCSPVGTRKFCGKGEGERNKGRALIRDCKICHLSFITKTSQWECRKCQSKRTRRNRKQKAVELLGGCCDICKYNKCLDALDFHHIDPDSKTNEVSTLIDAANFWEEVKKCRLLCCRCHAELHAENRIVAEMDEAPPCEGG